MMSVCILSCFTTVYRNLGFCRRPTPLPRLGTGTLRHYCKGLCNYTRKLEFVNNFTKSSIKLMNYEFRQIH